MKTMFIQIRVTEEEKEAFEKASQLAGISLSAWVRERLRRCAIRELREADLEVPFLKGLAD